MADTSKTARAAAEKPANRRKAAKKPAAAEQAPKKRAEVKSRRAKEAKAAPSVFDITNPALPESVETAALTSGGYPYDKRYKRKKYDRKIVPLQIELLKMLTWAKEAGERVVIVFEGRDGAGKGGTINRFTQHLPSRSARIVALSKPTEAERGQWYFQRYASQMPTRGEIAFFDRSWYNRAGVEPVMEFCSPAQTDEFLREAPAFEGMLARDGVRLIKLFFSIGREMQMKRLHDRYHDPLKRWKLSPIDFEAIPRWERYSAAFNTLLTRTHTERTPWTVIRSNDKLRARLNAMRHVLSVVPYAGKDLDAIGAVDEKIVIPAAEFVDDGGER